ncbi:MAG: hypothetical protein ACI9W4_000332 [Rhodothermales bacterium]
MLRSNLGVSSTGSNWQAKPEREGERAVSSNTGKHQVSLGLAVSDLAEGSHDLSEVHRAGACQSAARILVTMVLCFCAQPVLAQAVLVQASEGVQYSDTLRVGADLTVRIRPFVLQASLTVHEAAGENELAFSLDAVRGIIQLDVDTRPGTQVIAHYRALPLNLKTEYRLERVPIEERAAGTRGRGSRAPPAAGGQSGIRSRGSISRGVIAGSNRDVAVESGLRLELEGELAPGLDVRASLSDADSPIRPDGSTQRLSEFDRVFIEMTARSGRVVLGDFEGRLDGSLYASLNRKLQGVMISGGNRQGNSSMDISVRAAGATSRGEYQNQTLAAIDGVQGPYRLEGALGERFVLVLPGSERVYLDGQLLTRGESEDYILDYSLGELTFTGGNLIGADTRLTAEFQYSTNQFTRTLVASEVDLGFGRQFGSRRRFTLGGSLIREADTGEFLSEFGLSAADSVLLVSAGDAPASRSGAREVAYDPEARFTQYTLEQMAADSVFVAVVSRPGPRVTVYRVQFSRVGEGLGSYRRDSQSINGISYVYRGEGLGAYEPIRLLPRPRLKSVLDLRGSVMPFRGLTLDGEAARSLNDLNRLSPLDEGDNAGTAFRVGISMDPADTPLGRFGVGIDANRTSRSFATFERYREVEFARRWNLPSQTALRAGTVVGADYEQEVTGTLFWSPLDSLQAEMSMAKLDLPGIFQGDRATLEAAYNRSGRPAAALRSTSVRSDDFVRQASGTWRNDHLRFDHAYRSLDLSLELESEKRADWLADSLGASSLRYLEIRPGVAYEKDATTWRAQVERRLESWPQGNQLVRAADSWTLSTGAETARPGGTRGSVDIAWRSRNVRDGFEGLAAGTDTRALLVNTNGATRAGWVQLDWLYDARTERTPVLQEIYLRAGPELGAYIWDDANGDDVVQLDELLPETTPNEGTYIRTFLPSDSLAAVNSVRARLVGRYRPPARPDASLRWNGQTVFDVHEQSRTSSRLDVYLLRLDRFRTPGVTTGGRLRVRQDISVSHPASGLSLDASMQENRALSELASGVETRAGRILEASLGYRLSPRLQTAIRVAAERDDTDSDLFASRRFQLRTRSVRPSATLRWGAFIAQIAGELGRKRDDLAGREASLLKVPVSIRWAEAGKADILTRFEVSSVALSGPVAAGLAEFELTDGRGQGTAYLWGLTAQWSLSGNLRATIAYDGRAPAGRDVIHTGRVQMSALF